MRPLKSPRVLIGLLVEMCIRDRNGSYYVDLSTGIEKTNYILVYQDTYVFGRGYLGLTKLEVPEKYLTIR